MRRSIGQNASNGSDCRTVDEKRGGVETGTDGGLEYSSANLESTSTVAEGSRSYRQLKSHLFV